MVCEERKRLGGWPGKATHAREMRGSNELMGVVLQGNLQVAKMDGE